MRKLLWLAAATILSLPANASPKQSGQTVSGQPNQTSQAQPSSAGPEAGSQGQPPAANSQKDSLAAASRKAKAQLKEAPKTARVFTNDNLPLAGDISTVGAAPPSKSSAGATTAKPAAGSDEKMWREKFATLHHKLEQDQETLSIMQRELGVLNVQYYNDPQQALQQQYSRDDINKKTADIDAKKEQVEADQQAISDAQSELRKAGGDPGWAE